METGSITFNETSVAHRLMVKGLEAYRLETENELLKLRLKEIHKISGRATKNGLKRIHEISYCGV